MIIDSHHHFWDRSLSQFDYSWQEDAELKKICQSFLPEDLKPQIDATGVDKTIFVQTQHNLLENDWAFDLTESHDWIAGIVGWVDLASPDCESQVERLKDHSKLPRSFLFVGPTWSAQKTNKVFSNHFCRFAFSQKSLKA